MAAAKRQQLQVVYRPIEALIPYARNSRVHSDAQVAQIAASIREFGFTSPVLLDGEDGIIAGHGRVLASRKLQMAEVPCIVLAHLSETQKRALVIADNKLGLNSAWDEEMLVMELGDLSSDGFDLTITGFDLKEIELMRDGWNPNFEKIDKTEADLGDGLAKVIKVTCNSTDAEQVVTVIKEAIHAAGLRDVSVAGP